MNNFISKINGKYFIRICTPFILVLPLIFMSFMDGSATTGIWGEVRLVTTKFAIIISYPFEMLLSIFKMNVSEWFFTGYIIDSVILSIIIERIISYFKRSGE